MAAPDDSEKLAEKIGIYSHEVRIETAIFTQISETSNKGANEDLQQAQKILEPSPGLNSNQNINTHSKTLSSCQEHLSQLKASLHNIYSNTSGKTAEVTKNDLRNLIDLLSNADGLLYQVWQEISEEEDRL
jgi:hypothetical protein